ncbi:MAG: pectinesterase family protein [Candidatus Thermoplasmatota archaeon]|jgi:parallel beta-helix repeat protein|nr:pectinesterase family protein [Candidatus Thermoplasmatota archaeon]
MKIQYDSLKKIFTLGIIIVFLGVCFYPATAQPVKQAFSSPQGNWLYVGGAGPGNYTKIQDAIDNASTGDTIYVYQGTYHEALIIDTWSLTIIGENRDTTIIETNTSEDTITIKKSDISIHGFTIIGEDSGIYVRGELFSITISDNNIMQCYRGVEFQYDWDNFQIILENNNFYLNHCGIYLFGDLWPITIRNNLFDENFNGMEVGGTFLVIENNTFKNSQGSGLVLYGRESNIQGNVFLENGYGLSGGGEKHTITGNLFLDNRVGLSLGGSTHQITGNLFKNNSFGVAITGFATTVSQNNFIQNEKDAWFAEENRSHGNIWDNNYWTDSLHLLSRTLIFGKIHTHIKKFLQFNPYETTYFWMPWINVDANPAKDPFPIE